MSLIGLPGLEMIAAGKEIEACLLGGGADLHQLRYGELLMRQHVADHTVAQAGGFLPRFGRRGCRSGIEDRIIHVICLSHPLGQCAQRAAVPTEADGGRRRRTTANRLGSP
jgi:hypothetical protein